MNRRDLLRYVLGTAAGAAVAAVVSEHAQARVSMMQGTVEHMDGVPSACTNIETGIMTPAGAPLPLLPASAYPAHSHPLTPAFPQFPQDVTLEPLWQMVNSPHHPLFAAYWNSPEQVFPEYDGANFGLIRRVAPDGKWYQYGIRDTAGWRDYFPARSSLSWQGTSHEDISRTVRMLYAMEVARLKHDAVAAALTTMDAERAATLRQRAVDDADYAAALSKQRQIGALKVSYSGGAYTSLVPALPGTASPAPVMMRVTGPCK